MSAEPAPESTSKPKARRDSAVPTEPVSEQAVLSIMLQCPTEAIPVVQRTLTVEDFFSARQFVFQAICDLFNQGTPVSILTVYRHLSGKNQLDSIGGPGELADLQTFVLIRDFSASAKELSWHLSKLLEASRRRHVLKTARSLSAQANTEDVDLDAAAGQFLALAKARPAIAAKGPQHVRQFILQAIQEIEDASRGDSYALSTGHPALDEKLGGGLRPHSYTVVAARPSLGKTSLTMDILWHITDLANTAVAGISLETKGSNLMKRLLSSVSGVPFSRLREGRFTKPELARIMAAQRRVDSRAMFLHDPGAIDCNQIRNEVRTLFTDYGVKVIMIDYLQLVRNSIKGNEKEYDRVTEVSQTIKELTQEYPIAVLAVCQLKRNDNRAPTMEDLRSSGQIEQDATEILLLSEPAASSDDDPDIDLTIRVAKQKDGARGDVTLRFHRPTFSFSAAAHQDEPETVSFPPRTR